MERQDRSALLLAVINETRSLSHKLKRAAEELHGQGESSAGRRGVLLSLARLGPQTVPQLARARPVSRQHIQSHVNLLLEDGLVRAEPNPAHKRSPLIALTRAGTAAVREIEKVEGAVLRDVDLPVSAADLATAARVLRELASFFEGRDWSEVAKKARRGRGRG
jgi:DNA-binding MarR family transcriptional regulator